MPGQFRSRARVSLKKESKEKEEIRFEVLGELGRGSYAIVRLGIDNKTQNKIAIKVYEKSNCDYASIKR